MDPFGQFRDSDLELALEDAAFYRFSQQAQSALLSEGQTNYTKQEDINLDSVAKDLSQGQQQLVTLAYALLRTDKRLILLDEPTSQIDHVS